jgi:TFIIF-interacting CTD phosphatase-like protein
LGKKDPTTERLLTEVTGPTKPVLVLPLEDFLIHQPYNSGNLAKRPNASEFLQAASKFYEVVIISESNKDVRIFDLKLTE